MSWKADIQEWIDSWFKLGEATIDQFKKTQDVAIRGGWDPKRYIPRMKQDLHNWLSDWYTLSIKKLTTPATRRNPISYYSWPKRYNPNQYVQDYYD